MDSRGNSMGERDSGTDSNKANINYMESTEAESKGVQNPPMYSELQQDAAKYRDDYVMATAMEENVAIKEGGAQPGSITRGMMSTGGDAVVRQLKTVLEIDKSLTQSCHVPYGNDSYSVMDERKLPSSACLTMLLGLCHTKSADSDNNSLTVVNPSGTFVGPFEPNGDERNQIKMSGLNPIRTKPRQLFPKQSQMQQPSYSETPKQPQMHQLNQPETPKKISPQVPIRVARPPVEGRGRNQLLPRYWPRITDQELQQITAGDSNCTITPLFEKMLSASDAGRIGRLVLPKACAEAYFPPISQPEGLPLKIQDVSGKDWVFQFRFWPNNNSRMYVLEGVTPCIQSMQLQAGDTVTFSRLDPEGKLVMGYRRAPSSLSSQETQTSIVGSTTLAPLNLIDGGGSMDNFSNIASLTGLLSQSVKGVEAQANGMPGHLNLSDTGYGWHNSDKAGYKEKESSYFHSLLVGEKKKPRPASLKNKRPLTNVDEAIEFRITWEEAQDLLRSPPNVAPSIVMIEGYAFEEYEEPPIFGKRTIFTSKNFGPGEDQWAQCDDCGSWRKVPFDVFLPTRWVCGDNVWDPERNSCNALQEVENEDIKYLVQHVKDVKKQEVEEPLKVTEPLSGLEALANAATVGENNTPAATTKHPRHRPGCTCIVCIQPPSGKGPKHKPTCNCNVCMTVKRRFKTLMMRRKKRQSEREAEHAARKEKSWTKDDGVGGLNSGAKWQNDSYGYCEGVSSMQGNLVVAFPGALPRAPNFPATTNGKRFSSNDALSSSPCAGRSYVDDCKGHIDLNSQPERDEEANRSAFRVSMVRLLQNASHPLDSYLKEHGLASLVGPQQIMHPSMSFGRSIVEREADKHIHNQPTAVFSSERSQDEIHMSLGMAKFDTAND